MIKQNVIEIIDDLETYIYDLGDTGKTSFAIHAAFDYLINKGLSENNALSICDLYDCMVREINNII